MSFAWNYTSLSVTPSKVDILVSCSANSATYTISNNATFQPTASVVWDTAPDVTGTAPLLTETYTLVIHDAAQAVTAVAGAGHLGTSNQLMFGMYLPQKYTKLAGMSLYLIVLAFAKASTDAWAIRLDLCRMQRRRFRHRTTGFQIHDRHVCNHRSILHLVCVWFWRPSLDPSTCQYPRLGTYLRP